MNRIYKDILYNNILHNSYNIENRQHTCSHGTRFKKSIVNPCVGWGPPPSMHVKTKPYKYSPKSREGGTFFPRRTHVQTNSENTQIMPPKRYKVVAKKYKHPPCKGESSHPLVESNHLLIKGNRPHVEDSNSLVDYNIPPVGNSNPQGEDKSQPVREFTQHQWHLLIRRFSMSQVYWFMHNNKTKVGEFVDMVLASEEAKTPSHSPPKKDIPDDYLDDLLRDDYQPAIESEPEEEMTSLRFCVTCENFGYKEYMVRCASANTGTTLAAPMNPTEKERRTRTSASGYARNASPTQRSTRATSSHIGPRKT